MLKNKNLIKEVVYVTGSYPELDIILLTGKSEEQIRQHYHFNYTYVLYLELGNKKDIISWSQSTTTPIATDFDVKFVDYFSNQPSRDLLDFIYLCTLYRKQGTEKKLFKFYNGSIDFLKDYLKQTYGRLIYKQQGVNLLKFYSNISDKEASLLINGLNDWNTLIRGACETIKIQDNYNFRNLWDEYTFNRRVYLPKDKIAQTLYTLMKTDD